jgi:predicted phosphodiesterase
MRIAAISDVHGNLGALDAVLAHIKTQAVDLTVNLGDLLSGGLQPRQTGDRLMALGLPTVRGNHERQVLTTPRDRMGRSDGWARDEMTPEQLAWFASLPLTRTVADGVLAFHGSPTDDLRYLLETVDAAGLRRATADEVGERLAGSDGYALLLCGHTHLQRTVTRAGGLVITNPGSVGWPAYADDEPYPYVIEAGSPHARYAVVDDASGRWHTTFHAVEYDWAAAAALAAHNDRPDLVGPLLTGRV